MERLILLWCSLWMLTACQPGPNPENSLTEADKADSQVTTAEDTIPRVTGIGGIFFAAENPTEIQSWYGKNLGLALDDYGSPFEFRNANRPEEINYLRWSPFATGDEYFAPAGKTFMINYRVQYIEKLVRNLRANGVVIVDSIQAFPYGKFVHILDPEGNKIELWEPVDSVLTKIGGKTTK